MQKQQAYLVLILGLVIAAIATLVNLPPQRGLDLRGGAQLTIQVKTTEEVTQITPEKLDAVKNVISNRVNKLGVSEAIVQTAKKDRIIVQLPGVSDPQDAEKVLGGTAQLDFRTQTDDPEITAELNVRQQEILELLQNQTTETSPEIVEEIAAKQARIAELSEKLYDKTGLTGKSLQRAYYGAGEIGNSWEVYLNFKSEGAKQFAEITKSIAGTGRSLGIFLDDQLISAPGVDGRYANTGITGGNVSISGNFTQDEARQLSLQLEGGALPLPVEIVENRTVGATLGQDSVRRSIYAGISGLVLVLVFMAIYYRLPGIIANLALVIYALFTLACYSLVGVTLTLPGIAGFILSIGMAVDANVLIFERTREELRSGKTLYRSVESGFYRAFSSIIDSNITTLIACIFLFALGSGLVRGFALTLGIGVLVSMFTAVTCSRTLMLFTVLNFPTVRKKPELFCPKLNQQVASNN